MSLTENDLKRFYNEMRGDQVITDPESDTRYIPRMQDEDPIQRLHTHIDWTQSNSVALLTGFRGNGKSIELHRLKGLLEQDGHYVVYLDMDAYVNKTQPLEITDLLLSILAALAHTLREQEGLNRLSQTYWERLVDFLQSEIKLNGFKLKTGLGEGAALELGASLRQEPTFKELVQEKLRAHVKDLFRQADDFVTQIAGEIQNRPERKDCKVVLLVDSLEHLRGGPGAEEVRKMQDSVLEVFSTHADKLRFSLTHVVYTVPPILALRANTAAQACGGDVAMWPNIHVRRRNGEPDPQGIALMRKIVAQRFPNWTGAITPDALDQLAWASGGDFREFFYLIRAVLVRLNVKTTAIEPADSAVARTVATQHGYNLDMTVTRELRQRMNIVERDKALKANDKDDHGPLMELLDGNLVMNYQNGEPWFDVHPLLANTPTPGA